MVTQQVAKQGFGAVTDEEWRKQRVAERTAQAKSGFAQALQAMATVVREYATPEEKAQFAAWLQTKRGTAADGNELREVYLPAIQAAGLLDMESDLLWEFNVKSGEINHGEISNGCNCNKSACNWTALAQSWRRMPRHFRTCNRSRCGKVRPRSIARREILPRSYELWIRRRQAMCLTWIHITWSCCWPRGPWIWCGWAPARQLQLRIKWSNSCWPTGNPIWFWLGLPRGRHGLPPVWKKAYTGLTGLYLREHTSPVRAAFFDALGGDATIGERIAHPADRNEQLAGEVWFYYGSRYGEYLDAEKDAQAEGYLEAELEHTPESANAYTQLADYSAQAGRAEYALADYQHSLDLKSDQPAVLDSIANLEWKQGRQADALAAWQLAVKRLAAEMDARHMPESFWGDFAQVVSDVAKNGQYATISQQVDDDAARLSRSATASIRRRSCWRPAITPTAIRWSGCWRLRQPPTIRARC